MHKIIGVCVSFQEQIFFKGRVGGEKEKPGKMQFFKKKKKAKQSFVVVVQVENLKFSRSQMTKQTSALESSREI